MIPKTRRSKKRKDEKTAVPVVFIGILVLMVLLFLGFAIVVNWG